MKALFHAQVILRGRVAVDLSIDKPIEETIEVEWDEKQDGSLTRALQMTEYNLLQDYYAAAKKRGLPECTIWVSFKRLYEKEQ